MKVDKLKLDEGLLVVDGKRKLCPYSTVETAGFKSQNPCGAWCALFTYERPNNDKVNVHLGCCSTTYGSM